MNNFLTYRGEFAALSAALIWAIASLIYAGLGKRLPPLILNLAKCTISIALILLTLLLRGDVSPNVPPVPALLLVTSGAIGIGLGDTAFFEALNCLGARRALLMEALAPPLAATLAVLFLDEQLSAIAWIGIVLTVVGVAWVVVERTPDAVQSSRHSWRGIGLGLLAALGQAGGAVLSRGALAGTDVSPLWSTLIRLTAGVIVLAIWIGSQKQSWQGFQPLRARRIILILIGASFFSTYLAIWLQQIALKYTAAGIAQALGATSPLFVIPIAIACGDRVSPRAILGVLVSLAGIWLLFDLS